MKFFLHTLFFILLVTQISFAQWVQVGLNGEVIKDIAVHNQNIFAVTSDSGKVYRSVDNGVNWTMIVDSCARDVTISPTGKVFNVRDSSLSSSGWERSLYASLDNGETWFWVEVLPYPGWYGELTSISVGPTGYLFLGVNVSLGPTLRRDGFAMSTDDGLTWIDPPPGDLWGGALFDFRGQQAITYGTHGGVTTSGIYFFSSTDYGITWDSLYRPEATVENWFLLNLVALGFFTNENIIVGSELNYGPEDPTYGVHISTDLCSTWTQITKINCKSGVSWSSGSTEGMLIGVDSLGVFLFSDEGDSLGSRNEGLTNLNIHTLSHDNNGYVYAGTDKGVWRRPLSEVTAVEENQIEIPSSYILLQNYPNPFNPNTKIKYSVPELSQVQIKIFDVLGNEIETLVNEEKSVGTYEITWNAAELPSGIYFYRIQAGSFIDTKKMILLK